MPTSLGPIILKETVAPSNPPSGHVALYSLDGSALLMKDDAGNVTTFGAGGGGGTKVSALTAASALDGTELVPVVQGGTTKRTTVADLRIVDTVRVVDTDQATTSTTPTAITALSGSVPAGTYLVKVWLCYQAAATTTGIQFYLDTTGGTVTRCVATWYTLTTGGAAATGIADQATTLTAQMMEGKGQRAEGVASGPMQGVDTANADQFAVLEGILIVTATTTLDVMFSTEVAGSAVTIQEGTSITLSKVA